MRRLAFSCILLTLVACTNNPYPSSHTGKNYYYSTFGEPPKHLDPARSYSSDEYTYLQLIYEPPLQYHFLKRPAQLIPLTATEVPRPEYFDAEGNPLGKNPPKEAVARAVYTIRIRPGIFYQNHPCFATDEQGNPLYMNLTEEDVKGIDWIDDFPKQGTRELIADDYVWQLKRMADPRQECPIYSNLLARYILGFEDLRKAIQQKLQTIRAKRREAAGPLYNQEEDERENPIFLDLDEFDCPGVKRVDRYTYQIVLRTQYPQMRYWLAMPFFSPVPKEADRFYSQGPLVKRNIRLDTAPIGTGPYRMETFAPNREIILTKNENFHGETYPTEGEPEDSQKGYLQDAGKPIPFIDKLIYKLEKEYIPRWTKFLQGYYDASGVSGDVFDKAFTAGEEGIRLSEEMQAKGIHLERSVGQAIYYFAFNMLDDVVGGLEEKKKKLRQAISIAIDNEEFNQIFFNSRFIPAHGPLPPGIFGYAKGREGMNPYVYNWDEKRGAPVRKSIEEARRLLAEAGYPNGRGADGKRLTLYYDTTAGGAGDKSFLDWMRKQFGKIGVDLQIRSTDYNTFRSKVRSGNFQILSWGWLADYPDPENFLMLLYGPNGKAKYGGENAANYDNPEFNRLFEQMETMENTPERREIIRRMVRIVQEDAPWIPRFHPVSYVLYHRWMTNTKPLVIGGGAEKYWAIHPGVRDELRRTWNRPVWWPMAVLAALLILTAIPAVHTILKREKRSAIS